MLADDESAILIDPTDEATVISEISQAMTRLANGPDHANQIAGCARRKAESEFTWTKVAESWSSPYDALIR